MAAKKDTRLAQTRQPDGTLVDRPWFPSELYHLYARGFRNGSGGHAMRPDHQGLLAYDRGYEDGRRATQEAVAAYAREIGYEPSILRAE
jgi:hypothetical protein